MSPTGWRILAIVAFVVYPFAIGGLAACIVRWSGRQHLCKRGGALFTVIGCFATAWYVITNGMGMMPVVTIVGSAVFVFAAAATGFLFGAILDLFVPTPVDAHKRSEETVANDNVDDENPHAAPKST